MLNIFYGFILPSETSQRIATFIARRGSDWKFPLGSVFRGLNKEDSVFQGSVFQSSVSPVSIFRVSVFQEPWASEIHFVNNDCRISFKIWIQLNFKLCFMGPAERASPAVWYISSEKIPWGQMWELTSDFLETKNRTKKSSVPKEKVQSTETKNRTKRKSSVPKEYGKQEQQV